MATVRTEALPQVAGETAAQHLERQAALASPENRLKEKERLFKEAEKYRQVWQATGGKADELEKDANTKAAGLRRQGTLKAGRHFGQLLVSKRYLLLWNSVTEMSMWLGCNTKTLHQWKNAQLTGAFALYEAKPELSLIESIREAKDANLGEEERTVKKLHEDQKKQSTIDNQYVDLYNKFMALSKEQQVKFCQKMMAVFTYYFDAGEIHRPVVEPQEVQEAREAQVREEVTA